jgi:hypothetical protein
VASQDLAPGDVVLNLPPIAAGVRNEKYIKAILFAESYGCKYSLYINNGCGMCSGIK